MLAGMGEALDLSPQPADTREIGELKDLQDLRAGLVKDGTQVNNRLKGREDPFVKRILKAQPKDVEHRLDLVEEEIETGIKWCKPIRRKHEILLSIPGVGKAAAAAIIAPLPEIGTLDRKRVASLAGVAPFTRQSGRWKGKAFIQGGRKHLRKALCMPALVAARWNPDLKAKYDQLTAAGKPPKVAIVAVMRKLLELANALMQADREWCGKPQREA